MAGSILLVMATGGAICRQERRCFDTHIHGTSSIVVRLVCSFRLGLGALFV
jgi:hypothetical protein